MLSVPHLKLDCALLQNDCNVIRLSKRMHAAYIFVKKTYYLQMIFCTVVLLLFCCIALPLRLSVSAQVDFDNLSADIVVNLFGARVFAEKMQVTDGLLVCKGSVKQCIVLRQMDLSGGVNLSRAVNVDDVVVLVGVNLLSSPQSVVAKRAFANALGKVSMFTNTQILCKTMPCFDKETVQIQTKLTTNLVEIAVCLVQQALCDWQKEKKWTVR